MPQDTNLSAELFAFDQLPHVSDEAKADDVRRQFLRAFPRNRLKELTVDDYVIGKGESFCAYVEPKTRAWANIQGTTSSKFGIYFGKTKSDPIKKYRFTRKFGNTKDEAFQAVKAALLDLVKAGQSRDFSAIDDNLLSQMFKAKILSLYFPDVYLNVCSADHLEQLASKLGISERPFVSEYQHLLLEEKLGNSVAKDWSNPKFVSFLYSKYINRDLNPAIAFRKYGSGGEGKAHKELKKWVSKHPEVLGLADVSRVTIEHAFLSGDSADLVFAHNSGNYTVIEIETTIALPGAHQAIKYRALLCAEKGLPLGTHRVKAMLVAWSIPSEVRGFCKKYGVDCREYKK